MKSWRTNTFGILAILYGLWVAKITYHARSFLMIAGTRTADRNWLGNLEFNLAYSWPGAIALILVGIGLIHARDHKTKDQ